MLGRAVGITFVIAGEDDRGILTHELGDTDRQTLEPSQLVIELGSGRGLLWFDNGGSYALNAAE
jgi:hypothetical protein